MHPRDAFDSLTSIELQGYTVHKFSILLVSILATGCTAKYAQQDVFPSQAKLDRQMPVTIATPVDGRYETTVYPASGDMTAAAAKTAFSHYANHVTVVDACRELGCLRQNSPSGYYVIPEILHWEDRATEWSGLPDKIEVKLAIYGPTGTQPLGSTILSGKSKWATFGGDHPQDLLHEPIAEYVKAQY
ncbi:DUF4823 domain-containing protein [Pseudomonas sp. Tri1]|uniref:DUF4823 domain-containing protein n=1 Tax=Pseudomonas sp. Tri1 TaxID=2823875 RepID=UPI001FF0B36C|nr:DUF4823 domain-containing protein [Pseudomonas sp. Tri1]